MWNSKLFKAILLSSSIAHSTTAQAEQVRVNCRLQGVRAWLEAVQNPGETPSIVVYHLLGSKTESLEFKSVDGFRAGSRSLVIEASAFKWSILDLQSDYRRFGGDFSNPEEAYWNGRLELTFQAVKDLKLTRGKFRVRCSHEI